MNPLRRIPETICRRETSPRTPQFLLAAFLFAAISGCGSDSTDPSGDGPIVIDPAIEAVLSRTTGAGDGTQIQDGFRLWIDDDYLDDIAAMRMGGLTDDAAEAGDPDGTVFEIVPAPGTALFAPGGDAQADLLAGDGSERASIVLVGPAVVSIISPVPGEQVSLDGFDVRWLGDGLGAVTIRITSEVDQTTWSEQTSNTGERAIAASSLVGFPRGPCRIEVIHEAVGSMTSVDLGVGPLDFVLTGQVTVGLSN